MDTTPHIYQLVHYGTGIYAFYLDSVLRWSGVSGAYPTGIRFGNAAVDGTYWSQFQSDFISITQGPAFLPPPFNYLPTVNITSPANNATYTAPANILITATASDSDGIVSTVEFYQGSTLLGTATTAPYSYVWSNVPVGTYSLTTKAIDNLNGQTTSSVVTVIVHPPPPRLLPLNSFGMFNGTFP